MGSNCKKCGALIENNENFCPNCGTNLKTIPLENKTNIEKYGRLLIFLLIIVIAIIGVSTALILSEEHVGTQIVSHGSLSLKIPANFEYGSVESGKYIDDNLKQKTWSNGDEQIEILIVGDGVTNNNPNSVLAELGGSREVKYGITGFHNYFQDGGEAFSFSKDNRIYSILVSDGKLFDKIEIV